MSENSQENTSTQLEEQAPPVEVDAGNKSSIDKIFDVWKELEAAPPDPQEEITVSGLSPEDPEYQTLLNVGVTADQLRTQSVPRRFLQKAGFVFNNYPLPNIEKPLIKTVIDGVDYGKRKLLTQHELNTIIHYQRQHPEQYGSGVVAADEFRKDVLQFLLTAEPNVPAHLDNKANTFRIALYNIREPHHWSSGEEWAKYEKDKRRKKIDSLQQELVKLHHDTVHASDFRAEDERKYIETYLKEEMPWESLDFGTRYPYKARGRNFSAFENRKRALNNVPSPFLDSGFHFPPSIGNPDFMVQKSDKTGVFRVNAMVLHLASRGVSEMGEGKDGKGEQDYSLGNYISEIFPPDQATQQANNEHERHKFDLRSSKNGKEIFLAIQKKMKELARQWAESDQAPPKAKELLVQIDKAEQQYANGKRPKLERFLDLFRRIQSK